MISPRRGGKGSKMSAGGSSTHHALLARSSRASRVHFFSFPSLRTPATQANRNNASSAKTITAAKLIKWYQLTRVATIVKSANHSYVILYFQKASKPFSKCLKEFKRISNIWSIFASGNSRSGGHSSHAVCVTAGQYDVPWLWLGSVQQIHLQHTTTVLYCSNLVPLIRKQNTCYNQAWSMNGKLQIERHVLKWYFQKPWLTA